MRAPATISASVFTGINERADPVRIGSSEGRMPLAEATNLDIDDTGMLTLRNGFRLTLPGQYHSLWSDGDVCLCKDGHGNLVKLNPDLNGYSVILPNLSPTARASYVKVLDDIFFTDDTVIGYIRGSKFYHLIDPGKQFKSALLPGHLIEYYRTRLYVARDNVIYFSEPGTHYYDRRTNFIPFPGRISLMKAVLDGLFISDNQYTYFLSGLSPKEGQLTKVADYPANPYTVVNIDAGEVGMNDLWGNVLIWSSPKGICLGALGGRFVNLTGDRVRQFRCMDNASIARLGKGKSQYIVVSKISKPKITEPILSINSMIQIAP